MVFAEDTGNWRGDHAPDKNNRCVSEGCYQRWPCDWAVLCEEIEDRDARLAALESAVRAVEVRWNDLCRCTDEFLPEYPDACAEYRGFLDTAIVRLLAVLNQRAGGDG